MYSTDSKGSPQEAAQATAAILKLYPVPPEPAAFAKALVELLSTYPQSVVQRAAKGIPLVISFLNLAKIKDCLDGWRSDEIEYQARVERHTRKALPDMVDRSNNPSVADLKAKYGENYGLKVPDAAPDKWGPGKSLQAPTWDQIVKSYAANPGRIGDLADYGARLRGELELSDALKRGFAP